MRVEAKFTVENAVCKCLFRRQHPTFLTVNLALTRTSGAALTPDVFLPSRFLGTDRSAQPQIIGMFGDMGTNIPAGAEVCKQMEGDHAILSFNLLVHVGDISYASTQVRNAHSLVPHPPVVACVFSFGRIRVINKMASYPGLL